MGKAENNLQDAVQTTGHVWDDDLQVLDNPLPNWWLKGFYASVVFAVIYWFLYPAWPVGAGYTKGIFNNITFVSGNGEAVSMHWNTRALLIEDLQEGKGALLNRKYMDKVAQASYADIFGDTEMMAFTRSVANSLFGDNCAACHGASGVGVIGLFPNIADNDWLWGGSIEAIENTIANGRRGFMPAFEATFDAQQLDDIATFVLSLSEHEVDAAAALRGGHIFRSEAGGCYYCHTKIGTGMESQGAADLTDPVWTIADINAAEGVDTRKTLLKRVIVDGVKREMPHWSDRLSPAQVKLLAVYVYELSDGQ